MDLLWIIIVVALINRLPLGCVAQVTNYFISPPRSNPGSAVDGGNYKDNTVLTSGTSEKIILTASFASYSLDLYQRLEPDSHQFIHNVDNHVGTGGVRTVPWTVNSYNATSSEGPIFFFWVQSPRSSDAFFMSHYFNITGDSNTLFSTRPTTSGSISTGLRSLTSTSTTAEVNMTTSKSSIPSIVTSTPTSGGLTTPLSTNTTAQANTKPTNPPQSSKTIALAIGLGIGIPLLILTTFLTLRLSKSRIKPTSSSGDSLSPPLNHENPPPTSLHEAPDSAILEAPWTHNAEKIHEVPDHAIVEAPGDFHGVEMTMERSPVELGEGLRRFSWQR